MCKYFYIKKCPKGGCSESSWKKAQVWGWTEKACREALQQHLEKSSYHCMMSAHDVNQCMQHVVVHESEYVQQGEEPHKRRRVDDAASAQASDAAHLPSSQGSYSAMPPPPSLRPALADSPPQPAPQVPQTFMLSGPMIEKIVFILTRAQNGVRACTRLSSAASAAFADEYENLEDAKRALQRLIGQDA